MYDVIVVGARCAGSPLAMLLARQGHRVLAVDRATFPSDIMSTHYIQPDGVQRLQAWGLYDRVLATNCPVIPSITFHLAGVPMPAPRDPALPDAICPRRIVLDKILFDAARDAGAEMREGFSVQEIAIEDGVVVGLRGRTSDGVTVDERARLTVGADGMHSIVARAVHAAEYDTRPAYTCGYYSYFSGVPLNGAEAYVGDKAGVLAFPTNDGLTCIGAGAPREQFHDYRADIVTPSPLTVSPVELSSLVPERVVGLVSVLVLACAGVSTNSATTAAMTSSEARRGVRGLRMVLLLVWMRLDQWRPIWI